MVCFCFIKLASHFGLFFVSQGWNLTFTIAPAHTSVESLCMKNIFIYIYMHWKCVFFTILSENGLPQNLWCLSSPAERLSHWYCPSICSSTYDWQLSIIFAYVNKNMALCRLALNGLQLVQLFYCTLETSWSRRIKIRIQFAVNQLDCTHPPFPSNDFVQSVVG